MPNKEKKSRLLKLGLSEQQKVLIAVLLTGAIVGGFYYVSSFGLTNLFKDEAVVNNSFLDDPAFQAEIQKLERIGDSVDINRIVYKTIAYEDLPIYPQGWVERNFNSTELKNTIISGPSGDPDGDGLVNKSEFLFGSNPKNAYTLCGSADQNRQECLLNDNENINSGISPLSGFPVETNRDLVISRQDDNFISSLEDSFDTASKEGVDFPTLYQLSQTIDLNQEMELIQVNTVPDGRDSFIAYIKLRLEVLRDILVDEEDNGVATLIQIYSYNRVEDLNREKDKFVILKSKLEAAQVPESYINTQKAFVLMLDKIISLIEHRSQRIQDNTIFSEENKKISKDLSIEVIWAYRSMSEELLNNDPTNSFTE